MPTYACRFLGRLNEDASALRAQHETITSHDADDARAKIKERFEVLGRIVVVLAQPNRS